MSEKSVTIQLVNKMGLQNHPLIVEKATELLRLIELKSSKIVATIGDYGRTVICVDLATTVLGIPFDTNDGIKASGLRKSVYLTYRRTLEKFLDLYKPVGINDICIRLGLNEYNKKANEIFTLYKNSIADNLYDIDLSHPQYPAMAVYQACKLEKVKVPKTKIVAFSHLKQMQWTKLEQQWDKLIQTSDLINKSQKRQIVEKETNRKKLKTKDDEQIKLKKSSESDEEFEDYEIWKRRMLAFAKLLPSEKFNQPAVDKENCR